MKFIDTHCHLYLDDFSTDIDAVIQRSVDAGIEKFFLPNIDSSSISNLKLLVEKYPERMFAMMGLHPTSVHENYLDELLIVESELENGNYIAVGEIGIDLYWDKTFLNLQQKALDFQLKLALKHNLPVVIHMRESFDETMEVIRPYKNQGLRGVFHCFSGTKSQGEEIIEFGFLLGIGGVLTFKNSGLASAIIDFELKHIVLETDAPYLAPTPHRGKRNDSSYIPIIAQKLAEMHHIDIAEVAKLTSQNAEKLFNLSL
jgi:TatD DNase family protein